MGSCTMASPRSCVIAAFLIIGSFSYEIKAVSEDDASSSELKTDLSSGIGKEAKKNQLEIFPVDNDVQKSKISFSEQALQDPVYVQNLRANLVKFLKRLEKDKVRKGRQDSGEEDGEDSGGGGGGAGGGVGGIGGAGNLGGAAGIAQIFGQLAGSSDAFAVLSTLPAVLPQFLTALTHVSSSINQGLNGTDTPNIPSLIVKSGSQLISAIQAHQSPAQGGAQPQQAQPQKVFGATVPGQRPQHQQPRPPPPNYGYLPQAYPEEVVRQPAQQQPAYHQPPRQQEAARPPPPAVNDNEPFPNPGHYPPPSYQNPGNAPAQPPPPQNLESRPSSMSLQQIYNHMAHSQDNRNQLLRIPVEPSGGNHYQEAGPPPQHQPPPPPQHQPPPPQHQPPPSQQQLPPQPTPEPYQPSVNYGAELEAEEWNRKQPLPVSTTPRYIYALPSGGNGVYIPSISSLHGEENAPQIGPQVNIKDANNGFINKSPYTPVKNNVLLSAPRLTPAPYLTLNKQPSKVGGGGFQNARPPPTYANGFVPHLNDYSTRRPGYWMNNMYYVKGAPAMAKAQAEHFLVSTTLRPVRRRKSTTTSAPEYYDDDKETGGGIDLETNHAKKKKKTEEVEFVTD